jgi:hypothetical protein
MSLYSDSQTGYFTCLAVVLTGVLDHGTDLCTRPAAENRSTTCVALHISRINGSLQGTHSRSTSIGTTRRPRPGTAYACKLINPTPDWHTVHHLSEYIKTTALLPLIL